MDKKVEELLRNNGKKSAKNKAAAPTNDTGKLSTVATTIGRTNS